MTKFVHKFKYPPTLLSLLALFVMSLLLHHSLNTAANAGHGCNNDYYHVHWERSSNPRVNDYAHSISLWEDQGVDYASVVDNSASNWTDSQGYVDFNKVTSGTPEHYVFIKDDPNDPAWGSTNENPDKCTATSSHLSFADVTLNSDAIEWEIEHNGKPTNLRWKVIEHELGHTLGLSHPSVGLQTPAIMHQGWNGYYWARTRDIQVLGWEPLYLHLD